MPKEPKEPIVLTADDVIAPSPGLIRAGICRLRITASGAHTSERFIEFFTAQPPQPQHAHGLCLGRPAVLRLVPATRLAAGHYQANDHGGLH